MARDDSAFARLQRGLQHGVEVGGEEVEAVVRPPRRQSAVAVTSMVVRDNPIVGGQVGDLVGPDGNRADDAVGQHDRIAVIWTEDLDVQRVPSPARTVMGRACGNASAAGNAIATPIGRGSAAAGKSYRQAGTGPSTRGG